MTGPKERTDLGFADALDEFDPAEWIHQASPVNDKPRRAETKKVAEAAGFRSREPNSVSADASGPTKAEPRLPEVRTEIEANGRAPTVAMAEADPPAPGKSLAPVASLQAPRDSSSQGNAPEVSHSSTMNPTAKASAPQSPPCQPSPLPDQSKTPIEQGKTQRPAQSRGRRTGRNAQFNVKTRPETIATLYAIADGHGWGVGETFEHAVALLERAYGLGGAHADGGAERSAAPGGAACT